MKWQGGVRTPRYVTPVQKVWNYDT